MSFFAQHHMGLVALSYVVSVSGAFVALHIADYIPRRDGGLNFGWLSLAAIAFGGCAIWAMHFMGMLAYRMETVATYDVMMTLASLLIPIVLSGLGFMVAYRWRDSIPAWIGAGIVFGLGVAAMHYLGMSALRTDAVMQHEHAFVLLAVAIAIVAATAALRIVVHWTSRMRMISPFIMGLAVCGMHYTAMMGMGFAPVADAATTNYFDGAWGARFMGFVSGLAVFLTLLTGAAMVAYRKALDIQPSRATLARA